MRTKLFKLLVTGITVCTLFSCGPQKVEQLPSFQFSSQIPPDINVNEKNRLVAENKIAQAQNLHDNFSWESFVAINWPINANGDLADSITSQGLPRWFNWKEAPEVFMDSAKTPAPWSSNDRHVPNYLGFTSDDATNKQSRLLYRASKMVTTADEIDQAFAGPLFDQNGNLTRYEVLMNKEEFDYIVDNELYSVNGQVKFANKNDNLANFPSGVFGDPEKVGALEIKLAWKQLIEGKDDFSRYLIAQADVMNIDGKTYTNDVIVGLVGMHINHKTSSAKQWVWSTFEHVDNIQVDGLETFKYNGVDVPLRPTYSNPDCEYCPVNTYKPLDSAMTDRTYVELTGESGVKPNLNYYIDQMMLIEGTSFYKTQVSRMIPIPEQTQKLNNRWRKALADIGSPLQYYELIGTQWPENQNQPPASPTYTDLPESVVNKPGGKPHPIFLTNMTMETFFQNGNQSASSFMEGGNQPDVISGEKVLFGTESCMGCHSSAGIAKSFAATKTLARNKKNYAGQLSADFVWLLNTQAHYINNDTILVQP